jgi:hypothetical protein
MVAIKWIIGDHQCTPLTLIPLLVETTLMIVDLYEVYFSHVYKEYNMIDDVLLKKAMHMENITLVSF